MTDTFPPDSGAGTPNFSRKLKSIAGQLDEISVQTTHIYDRVEAVEGDIGEFKKVLFGDDDRHTPGLVAESYEVRVMLHQWAALLQVGKWVATTFGMAAVALLFNLIFVWVQ